MAKQRVGWLVGAILLAPVSVFAGLVGGYQVSSGPYWQTNPPTYSCIEACAVVFGGSAGDYFCSTSDTVIDHQAYVSGWDDGTFCTTPVSETYKLNTFYNCGSPGCAYSAYVADWCFTATNYCWQANSRPLGEACTSGTQCASFFCVSGVCCNTACDQPFQQCNLPGSVGLCRVVGAPVPAASEPGLIALGLVLAVLGVVSLRRVILARRSPSVG